MLKKTELEKKRKSFNFDLDTNKLKTVFTDYTAAYYKLKASFLKRGFEHRQGSGYVSIEPLSEYAVNKIMQSIVKENIWLKNCVKKFDVADFPENHDMVNVIMRTKTPQQNNPTPKAVLRDDEELERD